jgi:hypothetical protein
LFAHPSGKNENQQTERAYTLLLLPSPYFHSSHTHTHYIT